MAEEKTCLLTASEIAERFQVQTEAVLAWARDGRIPCLRVSKKVIRFDYEAVKAALREGNDDR